MRLDEVVAAREEAERFIVAARDVEARAKTDRMLFYGSRSTATLRRRSMDLTRALADLRLGLSR